MVALTVSRLQRFRDDVDWHVFEREPQPEDLPEIDLWIDPTVSENDFDGFVAEALAGGVGVVASRTAINSLRLEQGRTGLLVPPGDPNELAHAILTALFKPEILEPRLVAAQQTASKFRARHRLKALTRLYDTLHS
jgi:glycosyltransferase involved in cell wall biosynthesis